MNRSKRKKSLAIRKIEGSKIDPEKAEVCWAYGQLLDPYGTEGITSSSYYHCWVKLCFARRPDSEIWVYLDDVPDSVRPKLYEKLRAMPPDDDLPWE